MWDLLRFVQSGELMECIGEEFLPWVAQYLVMKRASIEHNFHTLYSNFIDHLKKPEFLTVVIAETYRNIKVLLLLLLLWFCSYLIEWQLIAYLLILVRLIVIL